MVRALMEASGNEGLFWKGRGMLDWVWDLMQQRRIDDLRADADHDRASARTAEARLAELERAVESLTLMTMAMGEVLAEKGLASREELEERAREIDLSDGTLDGRAAPSPRACPRCGRTIAGGRTHCLYCGVSMREE
jgi:hypothetical protein